MDEYKNWFLIISRPSIWIKAFKQIVHKVYPWKLTWNLKIAQLKSGKSSPKPSFSGSMLIFQGVVEIAGLAPNQYATKKAGSWSTTKSQDGTTMKRLVINFPR